MVTPISHFVSFSVSQEKVHSTYSYHGVISTHLSFIVWVSTWLQRLSVPSLTVEFVDCILSFSSAAQSCSTLFDPMDCSTPGLPVHHQFLEPTQTHVHWVSDAIQPSHPLSSPSPPTFNLSQHQSVFQWASSSHQVAKGLEFQLQHQSFQWISRTNFL